MPSQLASKAISSSREGGPFSGSAGPPAAARRRAGRGGWGRRGRGVGGLAHLLVEHPALPAARVGVEHLEALGEPAQLADVVRPGVGEERLDEIRGHRVRGEARREEAPEEQEDVLAALRERGVRMTMPARRA